MLQGQARLNKSEVEIRTSLPDIDMTRGWTNDGGKYLTAEFPQGIFIYYFDEYGYTNLNLQIPRNMDETNTLVEIYNARYVATSKTSWTAYLDGGGVMQITMIYDDELQRYIFRYSN